MNTGFLDTNLTRTLPQWHLWGSCKNLHACISTLVNSGTSLSSAPTFQHIFVPFHRLQTFLGSLLLLPLLVMVYQIEPSNIVELQQHSPLSNNTSVSTYVHQMIISPHICLITWTTMNMLLRFSSAFWIVHNKNCVSLSFCCWEITFQRLYTGADLEMFDRGGPMELPPWRYIRIEVALK